MKDKFEKLREKFDEIPEELKTAVVLWIGAILFCSVFFGALLIGGTSISFFALFTGIVASVLVFLAIGTGKEFLLSGDSSNKLFKITITSILSIALIIGGACLFRFCLHDMLYSPPIPETNKICCKCGSDDARVREIGGEPYCDACNAIQEYYNSFN